MIDNLEDSLYIIHALGFNLHDLAHRLNVPYDKLIREPLTAKRFKRVNNAILESIKDKQCNNKRRFH